MPGINDAIVKFIVERKSGSIAVINKDPLASEGILNDVVAKLYKNSIKSFLEPHPEVLVLHKQDIGIDNVRAIHEFLQYNKPQLRTIIISDLGLVNDRAINALLKLTEEPPENALLLLASPSSEGRFATLLSRCFILHMPCNTKQHAGIDIYKYFLSQGALQSPSSQEVLEAAYMCASRMLTHAIYCHTELFHNESVALSDITKDVPTNNIAYSVAQVIDFVHEAINMKLSAESIAVAVKSKFQKLGIIQ